MVPFPIEFEHGLTALEMVPRDQTRRFELGQYTVDGRQTDFFVQIEQRPIDIFRALMPDVRGFHQLENLHSGQCDLEAGFFQFGGFHNCLLIQKTK